MGYINSAHTMEYQVAIYKDEAGLFMLKCKDVHATVLSNNTKYIE